MGGAARMEASQRKYVDILFDFAYLKAPDRYEDRVAADTVRAGRVWRRGAAALTAAARRACRWRTRSSRRRTRSC